MSQFNFYQPIVVRYGDLDPQGHVNNAKYLTYIEHARIGYIQHLGLWDGKSFQDVGIILADVQMTYLIPILWQQKIRVGVRVKRLGNKSFDFQYEIEDSQNGKVHATANTVQVAYDYHKSQTIPLPDIWRDKITAFEKL
jgi:acyl-CoA thioester hydrolase